MARICAVTGKRPKTGNQRTFSNKSSKRTFVPNLQTVRIRRNGRTVTLKVSASALRTMAKTVRGVR